MCCACGSGTCFPPGLYVRSFRACNRMVHPLLRVGYARCTTLDRPHPHTYLSRASSSTSIVRTDRPAALVAAGQVAQAAACGAGMPIKHKTELSSLCYLWGHCTTARARYVLPACSTQPQPQ